MKRGIYAIPYSTTRSVFLFDTDQQDAVENFLLLIGWKATEYRLTSQNPHAGIPIRVKVHKGKKYKYTLEG